MSSSFVSSGRPSKSFSDAVNSFTLLVASMTTFSAPIMSVSCCGETLGAPELLAESHLT
jgi:hypothetical protein